MSLPEYFTSDRKHKKSKKQEKRVAGGLDGRRQKGSGSQRFHKGDVRSGELLTECKRTDKKSMSLKLEWLEKITKEALSYGLTPGLAIEFEETPPFVSKDWVMVPADFLRELIDAGRNPTATGSGKRSPRKGD